MFNPQIENMPIYTHTLVSQKRICSAISQSGPAALLHGKLANTCLIKSTLHNGVMRSL